MADRKEQVSITHKYGQKLKEAAKRNNYRLSEDGVPSPAFIEARERYGRYFEHVKKGAVECDDNKIKEILLNMPGNCELLVMGEQHEISRHRHIISDCMEDLKVRGISMLALEHLPEELQESIDRFDPKDIRKIRENVKKGWVKYSSDAVDSIMQLILDAKAYGIGVIGLDKSLDIPTEEYEKDREKFMFSVLRRKMGQGKIMLLCGNDHSINARKEFRDIKISSMEISGDEAPRDNRRYLMRA
ncbi:MAG: hypothetical protein NTY68_01620, partial [Candidatus Micrarchaeota archaeon]|nr:hypothetical protein [Candidatus Micrarchaeota archaeon]